MHSNFMYGGESQFLLYALFSVCTKNKVIFQAYQRAGVKEY